MGAFQRALAELEDGLLDHEELGEIQVPETDEDLKDIVYDLTGMEIPDRAVCDGHCSPFQAFADAYFARTPISVWYASRGLGGKSVMLATLTFIEAVTWGAAVNLLGGSGEQSKRVHDYMTGEDTNLPDRFWGWPGAPKNLLRDSPTTKETRLTNHGRIKVLTASQKSVRGPHPQRLRMDEVDEMELAIFDASLGQPMTARGIPAQVVASSTWQNPNGTMTEVLKRAREQNWPVYEWCYKETATGWLTEQMISEKQSIIPAAMWNVEFELQEPNPEGRAIVADKVEAMFTERLGEVSGELDMLYKFEEPAPTASYAAGADWAKQSHYSVFTVLRTDVYPNRVVAWMRTNRKPWPEMVADFDAIVALYNAEAAHDATGLGDVVDDYSKSGATPIQLKGGYKQNLMSNYVAAIEDGELVSPRITFAYNQHRFASTADLFGHAHAPDSVISLMLARMASLGWSRGAGA